MSLTEDLLPALWVLVADAGHLEHGGWSMDSRDGELTCACGAVLYRLEPVQGVTP